MKFGFIKINEDHELDDVYFEHGKIIGYFHHEPCRAHDRQEELDLTHCADEEFLALLGVISIVGYEYDNSSIFNPKSEFMLGKVNIDDKVKLTKFLKYEYKGIEYYTINLDLLIGDKKG